LCSFIGNGGYALNILFCLTPKSEVDFIYDDASLNKAIQIFERNNFFILPLINKKGRFIGTISAADILGCIKENFDLSIKASAEFPVRNVKRIKEYKAVNGGTTSMEEIVDVALDQNFIPVVDDDYNFIGIITRKSIMNWMYSKVQPELIQKIK
jgi:CBS domain-containing protein